MLVLGAFHSHEKNATYRLQFAKLARLKFLAFIKKHHRHPLAALAGLALALAFPNFNLAGAAWIAPALLLASAHGKTGGAAWRLGYTGGLVFWLVSLSWLLEIPVTGFPILGWAALSAFMAIYPAFWVWLLAGKIGHGSWLRRCFWSLGGAATWVALEMVRARFLGGFPWIPLGASQWQLTPLIQIAASTGVYGLSFLVVWTALALHSSVIALLRNPTTRYIWLGEIALPTLVIMVAFNVGLARIRNAPTEDASLRVTFIQPAVPQTMIWDRAENTNRFNKLIALTQTALTNQTDLLLWPEAALPELTDETFAVLTNLARSHQTWMMFNADDVLPKAVPTPEASYDVFNTALLVDPEGRFVSSYHKRQLVIFGEYIPLVDYLPFVKWFTPITSGYTSGNRIGHFDLERRSPDRPVSEGSQQRTDLESGAPARIRTAPLICFEDMFPQHVRDHVDAETDLMVNLTNDGWFGNKAAQWQQAACSAFRAVENGVPLLRSCNNGITCWFDATGRMREIFRDASGSEYGVGFANWEIPHTSAPSRVATTYNRVGDRFGWTCVGVTVVLLLWRFKLRRNSKDQLPSSRETKSTKLQS
jgi:apolipoprotein N-acyltransferase